MLKDEGESMLAAITLMIVWVVAVFTGLIVYIIKYSRRQ